jgi:hypothetical protein
MSQEINDGHARIKSLTVGGASGEINESIYHITSAIFSIGERSN